MLIYVCTNCKHVLIKVNLTVKKTYEVTLCEDDSYYTTATSDPEKIWTCPMCNDTFVKELDLNRDNYYEIRNLLKDNKIEDAWEMLFEILL